MQHCQRRHPASGLVSLLLLLGILAGSTTGNSGPSFAADGSGLEAGPSAAADGLIASPEPDWPQWRGPRRDGISGETGLLSTWPEDGPRLLWKADGLGQGWSSPIIVKERLYVTGDVGDDLVVFALDLDGRRLWQARNGAAWQASFPGARASCAYSQGRLYHLNAHGRLACLDAADGRQVWAVDVLERFDAQNITWAVSECLLIDGPRVIVTPGGPQTLAAALDKQTGQTVWTSGPLEGDRTSHASPILFRYAGHRLIAGCSSGHGFGLDADRGQLLWSVPLKNVYGTNVSTPIYGGGRVYYVTPYAEDGRAYGLRAAGDRIGAEQVWHSPLDTVTGSGVLVGDTLYAAGYRRNKRWLGVDWATGQTRCEQPAFTTGAAVFADGRLYVFDETGMAGMLTPDANGLQVAARFRLVTRRVRDAWAHPVLLDGRLYLRYHDTLWCYDVKQP
ncbi:MAG: PQQ-binding-like beta-propeller repeat protein [Candidatus Anammoximicrobium sp.]|nr:PQQ-binding-like beta-propeller repeat protein [Candidatus Anammoximicrobium sp.]